MFPTSTLSLLIHNDAIVAVHLRAGPLGGRVLDGPVLERFLASGESEQRRALASLPAASRVVLTPPSSWCAVRPIRMGVAAWPAARPEIERNSDKFFPFPAGDALVGLVERHDPELAAPPTSGGAPPEAAASASGYLVAVQRSALTPWLDRIQSLLGRPVDVVLAPPIALLGLGLQHEAEAVVAEASPAGPPLAHRLRFGRIAELASPAGPSERFAASLPDEGAGLTPANLRAARDLAAASALAHRVAPADFAPLLGRNPSARRRWLTPAAAAVLAGLLLFASARTDAARHDSAMASLVEDERSIEPRYQAVSRARTEAARYSALIAAASGARTTGWRPILPVLSSARAVLPADGRSFLYRLDADDKTVTLKGEAARASDVLRRLEENPEFRNARSLAPAVAVPERSLESFDLRADRRPPAQPPGASGPAAKETAR
ncbi:MAG: PilN domain-containing protein [Phycisphaerales bacterium]|nr:PilN domain-containing protein [Phycisphaerales bacterium]